MRSLAIALLFGTTLLATPAAAGILRHKATDFRVRAPRGFTLRYELASGAYRIANKTGYLRYLLATSSTYADTAGGEILRALGGPVFASQGTADSFTADVGLDGALLHIEINRIGDALRVLTFGPVAKHRTGSRQAADRSVREGTGLLRLTPGQLAALQRIANGAQGGRAIRLRGDIALELFVTADGRARSLVPADRDGWLIGGSAGEIAGANAAKGAFAFGLPFIVQSPNDPVRNTQLPFGFFSDPVATLQYIVPQFFVINGAEFGNVQVVGIVPGTENFLGATAGGGSGMFGVLFTSAGGRPWEGLFSIGTTLLPNDPFGNWFVYMSYAAVPLDAPAGMGAALLQCWASFDPTPDQQRRRDEALYTILTTNFGSGPIDPDVFDAAAEKWNAYIRQ